MRKDLSYVHARINLRSWLNPEQSRALKGIEGTCPYAILEHPFRTHHTPKENLFLTKF